MRNFLPGLTRIIKIRKKRLEAAQKTSSEFSEETVMTTSSYESLLVTSTDDFRQVLNTTSQEGSDWITSSTSTVEHKDLSQLNKDYILLNGKIRSKSYVLQELIKG
jgi:predicted transcriptional regulator